MPATLPSHIWFVRSNGGMGSYPVTADGRRVVRNFVLGMAVSAVAAAILAIVGPYWLWPLVFVAGMGWSAWRFIDTARRHTDYSMTHAEYMRSSGDKDR